MEIKYKVIGTDNQKLKGGVDDEIVIPIEVWNKKVDKTLHKVMKQKGLQLQRIY